MSEETDKEQINVIVTLYKFGKTVYQKYKIIAFLIGGIGYGIVVGYNVYTNGKMAYENSLKIPALEKKVDSIGVVHNEDIKDLRTRIETDSLEYLQSVN